MENQKKFQFLILLFARLIQHFMVKKINKNYLKKKELLFKENQRKFQFLTLQSVKLILHFMDKLTNKNDLSNLKKKILLGELIL